MSLTKSYVKKLIDVRDAYEDERGHDPAMDTLVRDTIIELFMHANRHGEIQTANWCHEQLERENVSRRLRRAERLVPSGILDGDDFYFYDPPNVRMPRRPSANPSLSALRHDWNPSPHIGLHPYLYNFPDAPEPVAINPVFVPAAPLNPLSAIASAFNPDAKVRCNRCEQLGHRRAACTNPPVPGHHGSRGGRTRTNKGKKGKKSIRRGKH